MSWSVAVVGKSSAVATKIAAEFAKINCQKPEQEVVSRIVETIAGALGDLPGSCPVKVTASGSGHYHSDPDKSGFLQSFTVSFEPIYNFVE
jgi:hypothetical protein